MQQIPLSLPREYTFQYTHAKVLNRLVGLQTLPELAPYINTLLDAETIIIALEKQILIQEQLLSGKQNG